MRMPFQESTKNEDEEVVEDEEEEDTIVFLKPVIEDKNMELAKKCTEIISNVRYKEEYEKSKGRWTYVADTLQLTHEKNISAVTSDAKYKAKAKKELSNSFYQQMPATIDSVFAKEVMNLQSKVLYRKKYNAEKGISNYAQMKDLPDVKHAMEVNKHQSNAEYTKGKQEMCQEPTVLGRLDFDHAQKVSKLLSQIKYKEPLVKEMKNNCFNPLECAFFKQAQLASVLASDIKYKKESLNSLHKPTSAFPNLLQLEHALNASKIHSNYEYKKLFEKTKGLYHFEVNTAEQLHYKENAVLQSQVKYKEKYEKSKGKSMLEFIDTPTYLISKEAQKFQSEKIYRKEFEEKIRGKAALDLDKTPEFLHVKHVTDLLKEKEYKKDLEEGTKGKGLSVLEDTPDLIRVKNAAQILNEKEYRKDLEQEIKGRGVKFISETPDFQRAKRASEIVSEKEYRKDLETKIKGKGMQVGTDTPEIQRAKRASEIASQKEYKKHLEMEIKGKGMQVGTDTPDIQRAKKAYDLASQKEYMKDLETEIKGKGMLIGPDIPDIQRAMKASEIASQKKYKDEAVKMLCTYSAVPNTPEIERIKNAQRNISAVLYKKKLGAGITVAETPVTEHVKKNQKNISTVCYKEQLGKGTSVSVTPEMERVKKNQEIISSVKYSRDQQQMKGRPSVMLDTPELRHVKETQNIISMVKYHEDFEKTKGRGFTPVVDDPVTERVRRNTQVVSDAAYKGVHPHIVEMDRRPGIIVDLKVWRTDPGSIFDLDPLEDNIQSKSLHVLLEKARRSQYHLHSTSTSGVGDDKSDDSIFSYSSEATRLSNEGGAPVLPGAYQQNQPQGYGYMHQTSVSSMRSMHSQPHSASLRTYRAMYDYSAQDEDEVSFRDGDYIINVQPIDDGWMYGTVQRTGKTGMLPANYIEFVN
ncbi:nebulette isoform X3 [Pantherophis guttatus]|uniref:Nebulette isoform X3 n=1 Tax=Pantherophis guttatus TaxID=94885 RepID=A0A6P9AIS2_PANGU|nr:nebulette isoform X3 [Pantherophis guttatus]